MDGKNVKDLNVAWHREQIGLVSQEPVLFATTIKENIQHGNEDITDRQITAAAKEANIHDFICSLPDVSKSLPNLTHLCRVDCSVSTVWKDPFLIEEVFNYFSIIIPCFIEIPVFNANNVYPDQMPLTQNIQYSGERYRPILALLLSYDIAFIQWIMSSYKKWYDRALRNTW